jgi:hypothetical protein
MMTKNPEMDPAESLEQAGERADRAEQELRRLKQQLVSQTPLDREAASIRSSSERVDEARSSGGIEALRNDSMMAHLLDGLNEGKDIGHYGRLVFSMIALHFLPQEDVMEWLTKDNDFSREQAASMIRQVMSRDYNPPRRERILQWQAEQEFPIIPNANDPDCGNVYKSLKFPEDVYEHIQNYQAEKLEAEDSAA